MIVSLIVAMDENRGIGRDNRLPWHLSADLQRFKSLTMSHHLIVGRKTFDVIGRPLPGRTMIVVTRNRDYQAEGCLVTHSLGEALAMARERGEEEVFILGGGQIFAQALDLADRIYLTQVHAQVSADVYFPPFDEGEWIVTETSYHTADDKNEYPFTYKLLVRRVN